ncbi:MAG: hypothetical protein D3926_19655 [Desulfobacteraceae bacterium]|nr:MAG: hypothetical protein D3926_19655 [Desulfobacteraceae bacterium]
MSVIMGSLAPMIPISEIWGLEHALGQSERVTLNSWWNLRSPVTLDFKKPRISAFWSNFSISRARSPVSNAWFGHLSCPKQAVTE